MQTVTTWRDQEDEPYTKVINEAFPEPEPDWNKIDPPMKGQGLVNEALMLGASAGIAAAAKPIMGALGTAKTIDIGLNLIDPNPSDIALDQVTEFIRPANPIKVGAKGIRIFNDILTDVFDKRVQKADPVYAMSDAYSYRKGRALKNPIWDNLPEKTQKKFAEAGMDSDQAKFFIENWEGPR